MNSFFVKLSMVIIISLLLPSYSHAATASCYTLFGNKTASGKTVTRSSVWVAHKSLPLGKKIYVKYGNRKPIKATVDDRGPYIHGRQFDITYGLARKFGFSNCSAWGVRKIRVWSRK